VLSHKLKTKSTIVVSLTSCDFSTNLRWYRHEDRYGKSTRQMIFLPFGSSGLACEFSIDFTNQQANVFFDAA
jgi:hypothetical protein